ncbi:MAG: diadenylate cyclase [Bryobacteraceae bacterium]
MAGWLHWRSAVDLVVLSVAVYFLLRWARGTRALRVVLAIFALHALGRLAWRFELTITGWLLDIGSVLLVLMLLFFFQPELRHAFMRLDSVLGLGLRPGRGGDSGYEAVSQAAFEMAASRVGALIVIARRDSLRELVSGGTALGAQISAPILAAIFDKTSPLHDGALLVESGLISWAGVVLPLTQRENLPPEYGMRHRAALGIAERCDALVIVVSEERGTVTLMHGLDRVEVCTVDSLLARLRDLTAPAPVSLPARLKSWCFSNLRYKLAASGLAAVLWATFILGTGATVRIVSVPVEFSGVPAGLEIATQTPTRLEVQLRGASWMMASVQMTGLTARFDLKMAREGTLVLRVAPENLNLPPGVSVDRVRPEVLTVRLSRRTDANKP